MGGPRKVRLPKGRSRRLIIGDITIFDETYNASPDAVIVVDEGGEFLGYFSVRDYREATRKLEAHLLMAARLSRSRKAITDKKIEDDDSGGDLLDLLLGSNEDEEETEVPSMISLD